MSKRHTKLANRNVSSIIRQRINNGQSSTDNSSSSSSSISGFNVGNVKSGVGVDTEDQTNVSLQQERLSKEPFTPKRLLQSKDLRQMVLSRLDSENLIHMSTLNKSSVTQKREDEEKFKQEQIKLWIGNDPSRAIDLALDIPYLTEPLFSHLSNIKPSVQNEEQITKNKSLQVIHDIMLQSCPSDSGSNVYAYAMWKSQLLQLIQKHDMTWSVFESPWCSVIIVDKITLRITIANLSEIDDQDQNEALSVILSDSGWSQYCKSDWHKRSHKTQAYDGCCRLPRYIRQYLIEQLENNFMISTDIDKISCDLNMVYLPIFPPNHQSLPTFATSLSYMQTVLPELRLGIPKKVQTMIDNNDITGAGKEMIKFFPATIFHLGNIRIELHRKRDKLLRRFVHMVTNASEQQLVVAFPKSLFNIISSLLQRPGNKSIGMTFDSANILLLYLSSAFYRHNCKPENDTEDALQYRTVKNLHPLVSNKTNNNNKIQNYYHNLDVDTDMEIVMQKVFLLNQTLMAQPSNRQKEFKHGEHGSESHHLMDADFYKSKYEIDKRCKDIIISTSDCEYTTLQSNPDCTERCDDLLNVALDSLNDTVYLTRSPVYHTLHTSSGIQIHVECESPVYRGYIVHMSFTAFKGDDLLKNEINKMLPKDVERFISNIGSPSWLSKYTQSDFRDLMPNAWFVPDSLLKAIVKQLTTSHTAILNRGITTVYGTPYHLTFVLGGHLCKQLRIISTKHFVQSIRNEKNLRDSDKHDFMIAERDMRSRAIDLIFKSTSYQKNSFEILSLHIGTDLDKHYKLHMSNVNRFKDFTCMSERELKQNSFFRGMFEFSKHVPSSPNIATGNITIKLSINTKKNHVKIVITNYKLFEQVKTKWLNTFFVMLTTTTSENQTIKESDKDRYIEKWCVPWDRCETYNHILFKLLLIDSWTCIDDSFNGH